MEMLIQLLPLVLSAASNFESPHVTFYDHPVETDDLYHCCGGNQGSGHVVSIEGMPMNCVVAVRRPPAPAVAAAQPSAAPPGAT